MAISAQQYQDYLKSKGSSKVVPGALGNASASGIKQPVTGVSASTAAAGSGTKAMGGVPQSTPAAGSQQSHQAWINNSASGMGGMDTYTAKQNERYAQAMQSNNTDEISKLIADSQRVGYGLSYDAVKNTAPVQPMGGIPQDYVTAPRTSDQLNQHAQDQTAIDRAALLNAINTQIGNVKNNAEYSNQLVQDNRVLEDFFANQRVNPFSGGADYRQAMTARGRSIDDSSRAATLENTLGSLQQEITNFDKLTPERQRSIYNELLQLERQFGLNVGQLTGNYGGGRTLAGSQQDWGQQMDLTDRLGYLPNGNGVSAGNNSAAMNQLSALAGTQTLAGRQMDLASKESNWNAYMDMVNQTGNLGSGPKSNWQNLVNSAGSGQNTLSGNDQQFSQGVTMAQLTGYLPDGTRTSAQQQQELSNLWMVAQQTGTIPNELADLYGLQRGSRTQDAIAQAAQIGISQQNANTSSFSASNSAGNAAFGRLMEIWQNTGTAPAGLEGYGVSAGMPYAGGSGSKSAGNTISAQESANNYSLLLDDLAGGTASKAQARQLLQANGSYLTDADYKKLNDYINDNLD